MIEKLRRNFIIVAMLSVTIVLSVIIVSLNVANYDRAKDRADDILTVLAHNDGVFPNVTPGGEYSIETFFPGLVITLETPYETRYFRVMTNQDDEVSAIDLSRIETINYETAIAFGEEAIDSDEKKGYINDFRYLVTPQEDGNSMILFVDNRREMASFRSGLHNSLRVSIISLLAILFLVIYFSRKIVKPFADNFERQKQFVTDAGHEIKTPLSIISANNDVQELTEGENEWTTSTRKQIVRLNTLVEELLHLARFDENPEIKEKMNINFSQYINDSADSFALINEQKSIEFKRSIDDDVVIYGDGKALEKVISILLDNATKYVSDKGTIQVILERNRKKVVFEVRNTVDSMPNDLDRLFDRFYREDEARSQSSGGYGIGLSLAQSIVNQHDGKLIVKAYDENVISFEVTLPLSKVKDD